MSSLPTVVEDWVGLVAVAECSAQGVEDLLGSGRMSPLARQSTPSIPPAIPKTKRPDPRMCPDELDEHASAWQKSRAPFGSVLAKTSCKNARTGDAQGQATPGAFDS